jgi:hypothetical protein
VFGATTRRAAGLVTVVLAVVMAGVAVRRGSESLPQPITLPGAVAQESAGPLHVVEPADPVRLAGTTSVAPGLDGAPAPTEAGTPTTVPTSPNPDVSVPGFSLPPTSVPGVPVPDPTVPGATVPGVTIPGVTVPGVALPPVTLPVIPPITQPLITLPFGLRR